MALPNPEVQRYADALLALAEAVDAVPQVAADIDRAVALVEEDERVRRFLRDPLVRGEGKREALEEIFAGHVHHALVEFLRILQQEGRLDSLRDIAGLFFKKVSAQQDSASGELVSAAPLPDDLVREIEGQMSRVLGKQVQLHVKVDNQLLGGVLVRVGDFVVDGTVDRQLETMRRQLLA